MFPTQQIPDIPPGEFSRCEEREQGADHGKGLNQIQKTDAAIKEAIYDALWKDKVLRALDYYEIDVHVKNGIAYLFGYIVNSASQSRIENAMQAIPGIRGIVNNLVLDDKLILEVAAALGKLEHTYDCKFFTGAAHGVASLSGLVSDENVKLLAEKCAADTPNVRAVLNNVRIVGAGPGLQAQPFLQPAIGERIYFLDGIFGVVKQVILNPSNRCVVAMTVWGRFPDAGHVSPQPWNKGETQLPERLIVLTMGLVRSLTRDSGSLSINSSDWNRYVNFDRSFFIVPNKAWSPPYPYCLEDILFPIEYRDANFNANEVHQFLFTAISKNASLTQQLLANDSLGG